MDYHVSLRCVCSISAQRQNVGAHHLIAIVALASAIECPPELSRVFNPEGLLSKVVRHRMIKLDWHENGRRDQNHDGQVDQAEFVASHGRVFAAFLADPAAARSFVARSAGGFFDVLDIDSDGQLDLDDLVAFAAAYGHPTTGIAANLERMLAGLGLPPGRLPRDAFLTLVEQYWFDPSPEIPGRHLFDGVGLAEPGPEQPLTTNSVS